MLVMGHNGLRVDTSFNPSCIFHVHARRLSPPCNHKRFLRIDLVGPHMASGLVKRKVN